MQRKVVLFILLMLKTQIIVNSALYVLYGMVNNILIYDPSCKSFDYPLAKKLCQSMEWPHQLMGILKVSSIEAFFPCSVDPQCLTTLLCQFANDAC
jgi:hypothetical protein